VGKQTLNSGTTTVRRYVIESPAKQQVTLYARKGGRAAQAGDRCRHGKALTELTVEMIETSEVPLVAKGVKVMEEVVVRREHEVRRDRARHRPAG